MKISTITINSRFGLPVPNFLFTQDTPSEKLLVMLPGYGYTCEHPVLYYLRRAALAQHFDVLSVQYGFQVGKVELTGENTPYLLEDVQRTLEQTLPGGYRQICVVGKSLGTPLAVDLARTLTNELVSLILLTPIGNVTANLGLLRTLAIIGTGDDRYRPEEVAGFANHPTVVWKVFEGLNHSLEAGDDWRKSLNALIDITGTCEVFLG